MYLDNLYRIEKGEVLEQNPVEHLFDLPESLWCHYRLKWIISYFLGMMQTIHLQFLLHHNGLVNVVVNSDKDFFQKSEYTS